MVDILSHMAQSGKSQIKYLLSSSSIILFFTLNFRALTTVKILWIENVLELKHTHNI